jgi:glycosyltransferase involved in cell wall biosynthesis
MKILFISMPSIHVIRWIENLKNTSYEMYWFDVLGRGKLETIDSVTQFVHWKQRKVPNIKGEYFLSKKAPSIYNLFHSFLEVTVQEKLHDILLEIQPDIVHSFEMQHGSYPILKTMNKFRQIKWIYSCWGNDLYYYKNYKSHDKKIRQVLKRINYLHTDCDRDHVLAKKLGFKGRHLGVIPGGSGYDLEAFSKFKTPISDRRIILVKGYQHTFGRALNVIKALHSIPEIVKTYEVVVFGAHSEVIEYIALNQLEFKTFTRNELSQHEVMQLMGKSLIYIGNNISDGMPNTLLEAIIMNAFPIQSNPGNATSEVIDNGKNGLLIADPEDVKAIEGLIISAIENPLRIASAAVMNTKIAREKLDEKNIRKEIISLYNQLS